MHRSRAVVVLSGGQDSTTCLYWAKNNYEHVSALSFDYGQKHKVELESAAKIAALANLKHEVINVKGILKSRSPLTDPNVKLETYSDYESMDKIIGDRIELTFVPMRNAFFLTVAANHALYMNCKTLVTGVCQQDNANYPDCRQEFIDKQQAAINAALGIQDFEIQTPLMNMSKAESVHLARELPGCWAGLSYSHTCYAGAQPPCILTKKEACHACTLRAQGFKEAGLADPMIERYEKELTVK